MKDDIYDEGSRREFLELAAQIDVPAFIRRGLYVEEAVTNLITVCAAQRVEMLEFPRLRLGTLAAMISHHWTRLDEFIGAETAQYYADLHEAWQPELRVPVAMTDSPKKIRRALQDLARSIEKFNRKWESYLAGVSLDEVNHARDQYNKYYVCEKAAAFQNERLGQEGFEELPPYAAEELLLELPYLKVPQLRG